jgi:hypothetical protein
MVGLRLAHCQRVERAMGLMDQGTGGSLFPGPGGARPGTNAGGGNAGGAPPTPATPYVSQATPCPALVTDGCS